MKKLIIILIALIILSACGALPQATSQPTATPSPTGTPDLQATGTAQVYAFWTEMYQTLTAQPPQAMPVPTATGTLLTDTPTPAETTPTPIPALQPGQPVTLTSIHMIDAATGWGIESSGHFLRTRDGGLTWQDVTPPQSGIVAFLDSTHAWATLKASDVCDASRMTWGEYQDCMPVSEVVIWRTEDGGQTWLASMPFATGNPHYKPIAIQFVNARIGWFLYVDSYGPMGSTTMGIFRTNDGGVTWISGRFPYHTCIHTGMVFTNENNGWSGGDCGRWSPIMGMSVRDFVSGKAALQLDRTLDGGQSWNEYSLPSPSVFPTDLTSPSVDANTEIRCGMTRMDRISQEAFTLGWTCTPAYSDSLFAEFSYEYLTPDGGQTWNSWLATGNEDFVSAVIGWRLSAIDKSKYNLEQTSDGGAHWSQVKTVQWGGTLDFVNEMEGWALATSGDVTALVHTKDGGQIWEEIKPVIANQ